MKKLVILITLLSVGCDYSTIHRLPSEGSLGGGGGEKVCTPAGEEPPVTFVQITNQILGSKCLSCHSAAVPRGGVNLEDYNSAVGWASNIQIQVANNLMPPSPRPALSVEEKDLINQWIADGTPADLDPNCKEDEPDPKPGNPGESEPPGEPEPPGDIVEVPPDAEITYALIKTRILDRKCLSCHSDNGRNRGGLNLEIHKNVSENVRSIIFASEQGFMPPFPRDALSAIEIDVIKKWAELGTPF